MASVCVCVEAELGPAFGWLKATHNGSTGVGTRMGRAARGSGPLAVRASERTGASGAGRGERALARRGGRTGARSRIDCRQLRVQRGPRSRSRGRSRRRRHRRCRRRRRCRDFHGVHADLQDDFESAKWSTPTGLTSIRRRRSRRYRPDFARAAGQQRRRLGAGSRQQWRAAADANCVSLLKVPWSLPLPLNG